MDRPSAMGMIMPLAEMSLDDFLNMKKRNKLIEDQNKKSNNQLIKNEQTWKQYLGTIRLIDKINILLNISQGLSFLHQHNIAHLDIKPANVLIASPLHWYYKNFDQIIDINHSNQNFPQHTDMTIWISDFGLSKISFMNSLTNFAKNILSKIQMQASGTTGFIAPEITGLVGHEDEDKGANEINYVLCDIYSFGTLMNIVLSEKGVHDHKMDLFNFNAYKENEKDLLFEGFNYDINMIKDIELQLQNIVVNARDINPNQRNSSSKIYEKLLSIKNHIFK